MKRKLAIAGVLGAILSAGVAPSFAQEPAPPPGPPPAPPVLDNPLPPPAPPPLPPAAAFEVYAAIDGQQSGPHDEAALRELIRAGKLNAQTLVWEKGMAAWAPADTLPKVKALIAAVGGPPAVPFDCTGYLVGTWERTENIAGTQMTTQSILAPGGQFTGVQMAMGMTGTQFYGTWKASAVGQKACSMTWDMQYPYTNSTTIVFTIIDQNSMAQQGSNAQIRRVQ